MASPIPHILVLPFPAQGHILPLLDLLHRLCLGFNLRFTIVTTPNNASLFTPLIDSHPSLITTLIFPLPPNPSLPSGIENIRDIGRAGIIAMVAALKQLVPLVSHWLRSQTDLPVAVIYDMFLGWTASLAHELAIPHFVYYSNGAFSTSVIEYCWYHEHIRDMESIELKDLPGSPSFKRRELPNTFRCYEKNNPDSEILRDGFLCNVNAYGCIINTFEEIEGKYVSHIAQEKGHNRVYSVGPPSLQGLKGEMVDSDLTMSWIFDWLDGCASESVIYLCFGSQKFMSEEQMRGIAGGLEESGRRFVWVVNGSARNGKLQDGFEKRMREEGRGIVVKEWAPQRRILGHSAVGGFLTHCGWNSTMEGIQCGVRFLTWPMEAEQYQNAWLLENELRVGERVCEGPESIPDRKLFGRLVRLWDADTEDVKAARARAAVLKEKASAAMFGSSSRNIQNLANHFCQLEIQKSIT